MSLFKKAVSYFHDNFIDKKFSTHKKQYIFQCVLATFVVLLLLLAINVISNELVIASIASTTFTIFASPHHKLSRFRYVFGGYIVGIGVGLFCSLFILNKLTLIGWFFNIHHELVGALSVGASLFLMVVLDLEHPPAASMALALVITNWSIESLVVTLLFILGLCTFRKVFAKHLIALD